jgi:integrase
VTKVTPLPHRHGRIRVHFRRDKGRRIALPSTIGSDEFRAAYQAAITSQSVVKREQLSSAASGRIAALVISYMRGSTYVCFGVPLGCKPHGLRKAAGRRLAEAGCSTNEIMSVLGHKSLAEAERYAREADQSKLATAAVKLEGRHVNRIAQTDALSLGKNPKNKDESK